MEAEQHLLGGLRLHRSFWSRSPIRRGFERCVELLCERAEGEIIGTPQITSGGERCPDAQLQSGGAGRKAIDGKGDSGVPLRKGPTVES